MKRLQDIIIGDCFYYLCDWLINKPQYCEIKKRCESTKDKHLHVLGMMDFSLLNAVRKLKRLSLAK